MKITLNKHGIAVIDTEFKKFFKRNNCFGELTIRTETSDCGITLHTSDETKYYTGI